MKEITYSHVYRIEYETRSDTGALRLVWKKVVARSAREAVDKLIDAGIITVDTYVVGGKVVLSDVVV